MSLDVVQLESERYKIEREEEEDVERGGCRCDSCVVDMVERRRTGNIIGNDMWYCGGWVGGLVGLVGAYSVVEDDGKFNPFSNTQTHGKGYGRPLRFP